MEQLDHACRCVIDYGFVNIATHDNRTHRHGAVGQALGDNHHVRDHADRFGGKAGAGAAETGDDFIEYQQQAVFVADLAQTLKVTLGRHQHAGGTGERLDNDGGDVAGIV